MSNTKKAKPNLPSCQLIAEYWAARETPWGKSVILNEPACFACGYFVPDDLAKAWTSWKAAGGKYQLERAHIVPHALGGTATVDNLVLLCKLCHQESPDTGTPQHLFDWMRDCPRSVWNVHYTKIPKIRQTAQSLAGKISDATLDRWAAACACLRGRWLEVAEMDLGGINTHLNTFATSTMLVLIQRAYELLEAVDPRMDHMANETCKCKLGLADYKHDWVQQTIPAVSSNADV